MKRLKALLLILLCIALLMVMDWTDHRGDHQCFCTTDLHCATVHGLGPAGYILEGELP